MIKRISYLDKIDSLVNGLIIAARDYGESNCTGIGTGSIRDRVSKRCDDVTGEFLKLHKTIRKLRAENKALKVNSAPIRTRKEIEDKAEELRKEACIIGNSAFTLMAITSEIDILEWVLGKR